MRHLLLAATALTLAACTTATDPVVIAEAQPVATSEVQLLAINDFHGRLEAPKRSMTVTLEDGSEVEVPVGGAAYLKSTLDALDTGTSIRVAAGDLIGASPFASALFLDEPTIEAMEMMGLQYSALGNHEFDQGVDELRRIDEGGCEVFTLRTPCALKPYDGADFLYMAANVFEGDQVLMDATAIHEIAGRKIGFIGMPLDETPILVAPNRVSGLRFADEVETANALVPGLLEAGADTVVLLLHEGGRSERWQDPLCPDLSGPLAEMLPVLDEAISVVVSGHTSGPYACRVPMPSGEGYRVLTHTGRYGYMVADIRLKFDEDGFVEATGENVVVQGAPFVDADGRTIAPSDRLPRFAPDAAVQALVDEVVAAAEPQARRIVGRLSGPLDREASGYLIADSQHAATAAPEHGGADFALMNPGGIRALLEPAADGSVTFGQIFEVQPFGNSLMTITLTGDEIRRTLEQGLGVDEDGEEMVRPLYPSAQLTYAYDLSRAEDDHIVWIRLNGEPLDPAKDYRVTLNNFIANGGDGFDILPNGRDRTGAGADLDAIIAWLADGRDPPATGRIVDRTARAQ